MRVRSRNNSVRHAGYAMIIMADNVLVLTNGVYSIHLLLPGSNGSPINKLTLLISKSSLDELVESKQIGLSMNSILDSNYLIDEDKLLAIVLPVLSEYIVSNGIKVA